MRRAITLLRSRAKRAELPLTSTTSSSIMNVAFTRRHRFLSTFLYQLPFGKGGMFLNGGKGIVDRFVGGWELAGVLTFRPVHSLR